MLRASQSKITLGQDDRAKGPRGHAQEVWGALKRSHSDRERKRASREA
jgi:hypothetical protein